MHKHTTVARSLPLHSLPLMLHLVLLQFRVHFHPLAPVLLSCNFLFLPPTTRRQFRSFALSFLTCTPLRTNVCRLPLFTGTPLSQQHARWATTLPFFPNFSADYSLALVAARRFLPTVLELITDNTETRTHARTGATV